MPRYPFKCVTCRVATDVTTSVATRDQIVVACPCCGAPMMRQPTAAAFRLKGPGFFKTDYDTGERHAVED